jgi:hypothetical protein
VDALGLILILDIPRTSPSHRHSDHVPRESRWWCAGHICLLHAPAAALWPRRREGEWRSVEGRRSSIAGHRFWPSGSPVDLHMAVRCVSLCGNPLWHLSFILVQAQWNVSHTCTEYSQLLVSKMPYRQLPSCIWKLPWTALCGSEHSMQNCNLCARRALARIGGRICPAGKMLEYRVRCLQKKNVSSLHCHWVARVDITKPYMFRCIRARTFRIPRGSYFAQTSGA